ncbi:hypothetical protein LCGC14_1302390 [marine sediment metagenome]|uniref:Uncharacterized protein n=1 Tax=marine sediment metagenome TaxID=412755 RepID=A0A0F9NS45_9ZZZZ
MCCHGEYLEELKECCHEHREFGVAWGQDDEPIEAQGEG